MGSAVLFHACEEPRPTEALERFVVVPMQAALDAEGSSSMAPQYAALPANLGAHFGALSHACIQGDAPPRHALLRTLICAC